MKRNEALKLRSLIEQAVTSLFNKEASEGASLFPHLQYNDNFIKAGIRVHQNDIIKRTTIDIAFNKSKYNQLDNVLRKSLVPANMYILEAYLTCWEVL